MSTMATHRELQVHHCRGINLGLYRSSRKVEKSKIATLCIGNEDEVRAMTVRVKKAFDMMVEH
jgi:hypothetical protein